MTPESATRCKQSVTRHGTLLERVSASPRIHSRRSHRDCQVSLACSNLSEAALGSNGQRGFG